MHPVSLQPLVEGRYKAHNAHGGAGVKGQLFNVDLLVCERHEEEIEYVKPEA